MNIIGAIRDRALLGAAFRDLERWSSWLVFLRALFALEMSEENLETYRTHTGRQSPPSMPFSEAFAICGRRSGKSRIAAAIATYLACFRSYEEILSAGEIGVAMVLASDRKQARQILRYVDGFLTSSPLLSELVEERLKEEIRLRNSISIEVHTSSYRSVRGYSVVACIADELAFWQSEEMASPDTEVLNAVRPAMATVPGSLLLGISSPYSRRGVLWNAYKNSFGKDGDPVLVWQSDSRSMNPTLPARVVEEALERDPAAAGAEYLGQFRTDVESFVPVEAVEALVIAERRALPPTDRTRYFAFVDPSGGSQDSFTLAITHKTKEAIVLDVAIERKPPFSPESVVEEFAAVLRQYRVTTVKGDRYGGEFPRELFRKHGIAYSPSERTKSEIYVELLPLVTASKLELLDDRRLVAQLTSLERRTSRAGKDSIDHPPGGRDDVVNAAAGALVLAARLGGSESMPAGSPVIAVVERQPIYDRELDLGGDPWDRWRW